MYYNYKKQRPHQMSHQQMVQDPIHFSRFDNSRPRQNWIPRNKRTITKQDFGNQMDRDKPWRKKSKFDHSDKKQPIIRNYQNVSDSFKYYLINVIFNSRFNIF